MTEIDVLADGESLGILVGQDRRTCGLRLAYHVGCSRVIQEAVVDAARVPCVDTVSTSEGSIAYQRVPAAIVVACIVVGAVVILLHAS